MRRLGLLCLTGLLHTPVLAQETEPDAEAALPEDPNSQIGSTVKLSPQMRVLPRAEASDLDEQELRELQDMLRGYNRGGVRTRPLD